MTTEPGQGVFYIATGPTYVEEAVRSVASVRARAPDVSTAIATDRPDICEGAFDHVIRICDPEFGVGDKIAYLERTPFEKTLYLDTDTYVCSQACLPDIFELLSKFDIAAAHAPGRRLDLNNTSATPDVAVPDSFPWLNSGVVGYRSSDRFDEMLTAWMSRYREHAEVMESAPDQEAFREILYLSELGIATLPPEYNYRVGSGNQYLNGEVKLLHGHIDNLESVAQKVNSDYGPRVFHVHHFGGSGYISPIHYGPMERKVRKLLTILRHRGIRTTIKYLLRKIS